MRKLIIAAAGLAATLVAAGPAQAQYHGDRRREWRQEQRIHEGWRHGQISPREYARLRREQWRMDRYRHRSHYDDGRLSRRERQHLAAMRNHAGRDIYRQRHDRQGRYR